MKTGARFGLTLAAWFFAGHGCAWAGGASAGEVAGGPMPTSDFFHPAPVDKLRDFNPDRPSRFTGPFTVDPGHVQLEMDFANYTFDRHNPERVRVDVDQWNAAPFDLRLGLTSRTEIDFLYDGYLNLRTRDHDARTHSVQSGFGDLTLLFKYNLFGNDGGTFAFGILPYLKIPTNTANLKNKRVEGGVELPLSINLPANFNLSLQTEFDAIRNDADTRFEPAFTNIAYLGYTFLDKKLTFYGEWYSRVNVGPDSELDGEVDAGLIYYIGKSAEVDVGCDFGVTRAAPDYEPFAGFSVRF